jgi:hypothetical protein
MLRAAKPHHFASRSSSSNSFESLFATIQSRPRLAGVNPNSEAIRIIVSAWRLAIARYGDCIGSPVGDFIIAPYFCKASVASIRQPYAAQNGQGCAIEMAERTGLGELANDPVPFLSCQGAELRRTLNCRCWNGLISLRVGGPGTSLSVLTVLEHNPFLRRCRPECGWNLVWRDLR